MRIHLIAAIALALAAPPAAARAPEPSVASGQPNRGLQVIPLSIRTRTGVHRYRVEVAATPAQQQVGMMFRSSMPRDRGMIFPMNPPRPAAFWMSNTWLPLDLVFIAPGGRVLNVGQGVPMSLGLVESAGPVEAVLELNAGEAARIGVKPGDRVDWRGSSR